LIVMGPVELAGAELAGAELAGAELAGAEPDGMSVAFELPQAATRHVTARPAIRLLRLISSSSNSGGEADGPAAHLDMCSPFRTWVLPVGQ
jgi:hypothetical protein